MTYSSDDFLPLVYNELRRLAQTRLSKERPGQTLTPTALVHEAFMRLVKPVDRENWDTTGHFFSAAAEAMRRILIDNARKKNAKKHGGDCRKLDVDFSEISSNGKGRLSNQRLIELNDVLDEFAKDHPQEAELVKLRFFAGLTMEQAAEVVGLKLRTAQKKWQYSRARLRIMLGEPGNE